MNLRHCLGGVSTAILLILAPAAQADQCKPNCGYVTEVSHYKQEGKGTGLGAVAGGVAGGLLGHQIGSGSTNTIATVGGAAGGAYLGHQAEKKVREKKMVKVTVKLDNGTTQAFDYEEGKMSLAKGDRVQVTNGQVARYTGK